MTSEVPSTILKDLVFAITPTMTSKSEEPRVQESEPRFEHVENVNASGAAKRQEFLPKGVSETDDEKQHHWFVGSIDQGTTSSRFLIFNGEGNPVASHQIEFENMYPQSG